MNVRPYLRAALWGGGALVVVVLVSGTLWLALTGLGDEAGGQGARGVAYVALVCLALDLVAMIALLALAEISRTDDKDSGGPRP